MSSDRLLRYSLCVEWLSCNRLPHRDIELSACDRVLPPQHYRGLLSLRPDADSYCINSSLEERANTAMAAAAAI